MLIHLSSLFLNLFHETLPSTEVNVPINMLHSLKDNGDVYCQITTLN